MAATGIEIETDLPVQAVGFHHRPYFSEASRLLPYEELGSTYRVLAVADDAVESTSSFIVQATEDGTTVTIRPSALTLDLRPAWRDYDVALDRGMVVQVQSTGDLTGSEIVADAPVAVFAGGRAQTIDCDASSHAWDQLPPVSRWGTDYVASPLIDQDYGYLLVLANHDDTELTLDCEAAGTLAAGSSARFRIDGPTRLRANRPVLAAIVPPGGRCASPLVFGDPNLVVLTPTALTRPFATLQRLEDPSFADDQPLRDFESDPSPGGPPEIRRDRVLAFVPDAASLSGGSIVDEIVLDDATVVAVDLAEPVTLVAERLQGFVYGVSPFNAYTYGLGFDCEGCAATLSEPSSCDGGAR